MSGLIDSWRRLVCRVVGHRWGWPDIVVGLFPGGLRFLPQWRGCERCGHREQDERRAAAIHVVPGFEGPVAGFGGGGEMAALGDRVKREMGWE